MNSKRNSWPTFLLGQLMPAIKHLAAGLFLLLGYSSQLQACMEETPLTWTINSGTEYIADEALPGNTDGYLDFIWDGTFVVYGFYKNQTPVGSNGLDCGLFINSNGTNGGYVYVRHNSWYFQGYIANPGDHFRVAKEGDSYVIYHNGAVLYTGVASDPSMTVYPYVKDNSGLHANRIEYFKKPPVYTLDWIGSQSAYYFAGSELRRGQDGFIEYSYNNTGALFGFSKAKKASTATYAARILYSQSSQRMYMYLNGAYKGNIYVPLNSGDKLAIKRKGSMVIYSAGDVEQRYAVDGNADWHPFVYEFSPGQRILLRTSFTTEGGVCQDYFDRLHQGFNFDPDYYYPPSPTNENWNVVHTKVYNGVGEGPCHVISETKSYTNEMGYGVQQQTKDYLTGKVWATESIYDYLGRPAIATLAAPTGLDVLQYDTNFVRDIYGNPYDLYNFDRTHTSSGHETSNSTNTPTPVGNQANTLGAWYSSANTEEPWQATTQFPYTRTEYSELTGGVRRVAGAGDAQRMGNGHEVVSHTMKVGTELRYVLGQKKPICLLANTTYDEGGVISNKCSTAPTGYYSTLSKTITVDQDGKESVAFTDEDGNVIVQALSGKVNGSNRQLQNILIFVPGGEYRDIHVTDADNTINVGLSSNQYDVYDLSTDQKIISNTSANILNLSPGFYRVAAKNGTINLAYSLNYYNFSLNIYNKQNQLIATVSPKNIVHNEYVTQHSAYSFFRYDSYGQLIWKESPDAGRVKYKYRKDGQLRFTENAQQDADNDFSYIKYDKLGRPVESGEYINTPGSNFDNLNAYLDADFYPNYEVYKREKILSVYEVSDPTLPANREQQFVEGTLARTYNSDGTIWYSYDQEGRLSWTAQSVSGLTGVKYTDYKYDLQGNITEVIYQKDQSDEFRHHYTYDWNAQMTNVSTRSDGNDSTVPKLHAQYEYTASGIMDKVNLAEGLERRHYIYTLQGNLKAINPRDMTSADINSHRRIFSMGLDYYVNDYLAANGSRAGKVSDLINGSTLPYDGQANYSGLVAAQRWKARAVLGGNDFSGHFAYGYRYNHRNEFTRATFGQIIPNTSSVYDGAFSKMNDYKVLFIGDGYDLNGNTQQLLRYGKMVVFWITCLISMIILAEEIV